MGDLHSMTTPGPLDACVIALASSQDGPAGETWIHLLPAGTFSGKDGRGPYRAADPAAIMQTSRQLAGRNEIPVDYNHSIDLAARKGEAVRRSDLMEGPSVGLVTVTGVIGASTMAVFEEVAPHLGVKPAYSIAATLKRLCREARFAPVMLFDEAQNLTLRSARELLAISEEARIQMLFLGNAEVLKLVNSSQAAIQQIARRLPVREEIDCILDTDADLIAAAYDVEGMDAFRLCRELARVRHADGLGKVLPPARAIAEEAGSKVVRVDHLREALSTFPHFVRDLEAADAAPKVERQSSFKRLPKRR